jgi:hypothetical protein
MYWLNTTNRGKIHWFHVSRLLQVYLTAKARENGLKFMSTGIIEIYCCRMSDAARASQWLATYVFSLLVSSPGWFSLFPLPVGNWFQIFIVSYIHCDNLMGLIIHFGTHTCYGTLFWHYLTKIWHIWHRKPIYGMQINKWVPIYGTFVIGSTSTYGLWSTKRYGLWDMGEIGPFGGELTRWTHESMAYGRLWVITGMG